MNKYRCKSGRHYTDAEHNGKECPYDNMSASELSNIAKIEIEDKSKYQVVNTNISNQSLASASGTLTKMEWALWYKAVAETKKLGYWAEETLNGNAILRIETENSFKIVITSGTFEKPEAKFVYTFINSDYLIDAIEVVKKLW